MISQHHPGKEDLSSELVLFPCHSLSIETITGGTNSTNIAFFSNVKKKWDSWNNTESSSSSSSSSTTVDAVDPALSRFRAYLLAARRQNLGDRRDNERDNVHGKYGKESTSPAASSVSTTMTKSQSPKTPTHAGSRYGTEESSLLYFVIDQDVFCVDHRQIRSIEIQEASMHEKDVDPSVTLPMSLLFTFDSVVFRIFHDNVVSDDGGINVCEQESVLKKNVLKLKTFMLSDSHGMPEYREPNQSFLSYLDALSSPHINGDHFRASSADENGQTSNDALMTGNGKENIDDSSLEKKADGTTMHDTESAETNESWTGGHSLDEYLNSYEKSWHSLESVHSLLKLRTNVKIVNDLDEHNVFFGGLCNQSAMECMKSYVTSEQFLLLQESKAEEQLSDIEEAINRNVHKIFPAKGQVELQRSDDLELLQMQIEKQLSQYKQMVNAKHRALSFIPRR